MHIAYGSIYFDDNQIANGEILQFFYTDDRREAIINPVVKMQNPRDVG